MENVGFGPGKFPLFFCEWDCVNKGLDGGFESRVVQQLAPFRKASQALAPSS